MELIRTKGGGALSSFWEVKCKQGAWRSKLYILAPSEWEAGKQTEIALEQLGLAADVVEVNRFPSIRLESIQATSTLGENRCLLCDLPVEGPIGRRTVMSPKPKKVPLLGWVRVLGEVRTRVCSNCGKPEQWQINFGYIPETWFENQSRVIPFVGRTLIRTKEVNVP